MRTGLDIAGLKTPNNVFLAPLAGYTNLPFREMCSRLGAGLTFTEMVSCKGLHYGSEETRSLLRAGSIRPRAAQIFGNDPDIMREACESEALAPFDLIDVNMGCPMPKIVNNGEGSALLEDLPLAERVISACVKSGKRISVKFRVGVRRGDKMAAEFAKLCEGAGACLIEYCFMSAHIVLSKLEYLLTTENIHMGNEVPSVGAVALVVVPQAGNFAEQKAHECSGCQRPQMWLGAKVRPLLRTV